MAFIACLGCDGCDGSGKSAVIKAISSDARSRGIPVATGHWRPFPFQTHQEGLESAAADNPHGQKPRGPINSIVKLAWLGANWWLGWMGPLRRAAKDGVILFDRYHADLLVDPTRYRYGGPMSLARLASRFMPQPDLAIFLDADPEILLARKQEVTKEALERSRRAYLALAASHPRFHVVDASKPLDEVVASVLEHMRTKGGPKGGL